MTAPKNMLYYGDNLDILGEHLYLHVDTALKKACPLGAELLQALAPIAAAHAKLPRPAGSGRFVGQSVK